MTDWADEKAKAVLQGAITFALDTRTIAEIAVAQALREARAKGIEEAARFVEIEAEEFSLFMQTAAAIRKLKEQP